MFANYKSGYVRGDVFPMIQKMERFTKNATKPDNNTRPWVSKVKGTARKKEGEREGGRGREREGEGERGRGREREGGKKKTVITAEETLFLGFRKRYESPWLTTASADRFQGREKTGSKKGTMNTSIKEERGAYREVKGHHDVPFIG